MPGRIVSLTLNSLLCADGAVKNLLTQNSLFWIFLLQDVALAAPGSGQD